MSDSKNSYDQKVWEIQAASHARMKELLTHATSRVVIEMAKGRIKQIEDKYPQLKQ